MRGVWFCGMSGARHRLTEVHSMRLVISFAAIALFIVFIIFILIYFFIFYFFWGGLFAPIIWSSTRCRSASPKRAAGGCCKTFLPTLPL
jgi:hypothetical protein